MENELRAKYGKVETTYRRIAELKECFIGNSDCSTNIIAAHSLQENGYLNKIAANVNGNRCIYSMGKYEKREENGPIYFKAQGLNASSFLGFCKIHDDQIFKPVENGQQFNNTDEHCFLHSFRAYAHTFHKLKEQSKFFETTVPEIKKSTNAQLKHFKELTSTLLNDGIAIRKELIDYWQAKRYDELRYSVFVHSLFVPIAASFAFTTKLSYRGFPMFSVNDPLTNKAKVMMLTVLPEETGTIVILAGFKTCPYSMMFIDEFEALPQEVKNQIITSLLISHGEINTHFSPDIFHAMDGDELKAFMDVLEHFSYSNNRPPFYYNKGNFFETRFAKK